MEAKPKPSLHSFVVDQFGQYGLTKRAAQIAGLLLQGQTNREAAAQLFVSVDTIKTRCRHLFGKPGIGRRSEMLKVLNRAGDAVGDFGTGASQGPRCSSSGWLLWGRPAIVAISA